MSGRCLDVVLTMSGLCLEHKKCMESFWTPLKCVWNFSGQCRLEHVYTMRGPNPEPVWTVTGTCLDHVWMVSMSRPWTVYEPLDSGPSMECV